MAQSDNTFSYTHISTQTTTVAKPAAGVLHSININTGAASAVATVYDSLTGSGTVIAVVSGANPLQFMYDVAFLTGLTIVTSGGNADITVAWR